MAEGGEPISVARGSRDFDGRVQTGRDKDLREDRNLAVVICLRGHARERCRADLAHEGDGGAQATLWLTVHPSAAAPGRLVDRP